MIHRSPSRIAGQHLWLLVFLLVFLQLVLVSRLLWDTQPPGLIKPVLRVLAPESELVHSRISPFGPGMERELVELFANRTGVHPVWLHMDEAGTAWDELRRHRADLLVGFGYAPSRPFLDSLVAPVSAGPVYARHPVGMVHHRRHRPPKDLAEACLRGLLIPENPALMQTIAQLPLDLTREQTMAGESRCTAPLLSIADGPLPHQFAVMTTSEARFMLVDTGRFALWEPFFVDLQLAENLDASLEYRWFWRDDRNRLAPLLQEFWKDLLHDNELARIQDKYIGFLPESSDRHALLHLLTTLRSELPRYEKTILKAAQRYDIDPLLLIALIYHESRFDPEAVSRTGVRGIMQITQVTARELGLDDPMDARKSILAGARYLRQIYNRLDRPDLDEWDRWFLALSAYNQGIGHTWDAMALAESLDLKATSWNDVKSVFPLLSQREYFSKARHGYTRGFEAVAHVEAIRYYYYVLHGLLVLERPEGKYLGRLGRSGLLS
ncbi:transglycosylase SLT domain-containing protein [Desulfonatronum thioautotrophicum]|uniref:transglycosylase SLT domain-containing protein n=1 Tax=Desulfonatronum thioautotrophicum TaxID=617001 RepID=UPI000699779E|nr:transglycosylase SLT domain-containing protein [Desulfonatronum thioautotrophicum]